MFIVRVQSALNAITLILKHPSLIVAIPRIATNVLKITSFVYFQLKMFIAHSFQDLHEEIICKCTKATFVGKRTLQEFPPDSRRKKRILRVFAISFCDDLILQMQKSNPTLTQSQLSMADSCSSSLMYPIYPFTILNIQTKCYWILTLGR